MLNQKPKTTNRSFHGAVVFFGKSSGNNLIVRVRDVAEILGYPYAAALLRKAKSTYEPMIFPTSLSEGATLADTLYMVDKSAAPSILKEMMTKWLNVVEKEVKAELGIKDKPLLSVVPSHLQENRVTVRAFMALHNLELTDRNAQRLGLKATALRKAQGVKQELVDINIQTSSGGFLVRQENNYPHKLLQMAFTTLFIDQ